MSQDLTKEERIVDGVDFGHSPLDNSLSFHSDHPDLTDHLVYDPELNFLVFENTGTVAAANRGVSSVEPAHADMVHLLAFGLPKYVTGPKASGPKLASIINPVVNFRDLPDSEKTIAKQGKGVGPRMYNTPWALRGTSEDPDTVVAYSLTLHRKGILDLREEQDHTLVGKALRIGRHAGRIGMAEAYGLGKIRRSLVSDLTDKQLPLRERLSHLSKDMARLPKAQSEGLSEVVHNVHDDYMRRFNGSPDAVLLHQPPRADIRQALRGAEAAADIPQEFLIIRSAIMIRREGLYQARK